ncbi:MAG: hypothetical protein ACRDH8_05975 [Actinomycetota bacterium]
MTTSRMPTAATGPTEAWTLTIMKANRETADRNVPMSFCPAVHALAADSRMTPTTQLWIRRGRIPTKIATGNRTGESRINAAS